MKKALLIVVAILAVAFFIGNAEAIGEFSDTVVSGATMPMCVALVAMVMRYLTQAKSYQVGYEAVGHKSSFFHNLKLILSLVFINTFCLFSGATGLAFMIDDAHREGADGGQASSGSILTQIGFFAALFIISITGMVVMLATGQTLDVFIVGSGILAVVLLVLCSFYLIGFYAPRALFRIWAIVDKAVRAIMRLMKRELRDNWGRDQAKSFIEAARVLAGNPWGVVITIAYATLSALCNMSCLVAIGFAFGYDHIGPLVAAFAMAVVSIQISPTPQGIGVTEAVIAYVLCADGASMSTAAAIALVYRGIMLWLPFFVGAVFLSQMGFFKGKGDKTELTRKKDIGWVSGAILLMLGLVNIALSLFEEQLLPYAALTQFVDLQGIPAPIFWVHIVSGIVLIVLAIGLIKRFHDIWKLSIGVLALLAATELYFGVVQVAIALAAFIIWLAFQRRAFDVTGPITRYLRKKYAAEALAAPYAGAQGMGRADQEAHPTAQAPSNTQAGE